MRYFFNNDLLMCATMEWVKDYLYYGGFVENREEAEEGLRTCREFYGWYDCEVSADINEAMKNNA